MYLFDLASKLGKLNSRIYIDTRGGNRVTPEWTATGIYYREPGRVKRKYSAVMDNYVRNDASKFINDHYSGKKDKHLGGVALEWVPEYDIFVQPEPHSPAILVAPGWRGIVSRLARQGYFKIDRARRVFRCSSLGEQTYDKLNFEAKRRLAEKELEDGNRQYDIRL